MSSFEEVQPYKKERKKEDLWLISYADLVTNLMAVFIMMLAISNVDVQKFDAMSSKITAHENKNSLNELKKKVDEEIRGRALEKRVATELGLTGLQVEFLSGVLFDSASANLSDAAFKQALPILDILSRTDLKYKIAFEGHTDDVPVSRNANFRDNWDLSSARGAALLGKMKELGVAEERMSVAGYAHTRPKVPTKNRLGKDLEMARAANRRVVIRVFQ